MQKITVSALRTDELGQPAQDLCGHEIPPPDGLISVDQIDGSQADILAVIAVAGETVTLKKLGFGELTETVRLLAPVIGAFAGDDNDALSDYLIVHGDAICRALSLLSGRPESWVAELSIEDVLGLLQGALDALSNYMVARVYPRVAAMARNFQPGNRQP